MKKNKIVLIAIIIFLIISFALIYLFFNNDSKNAKGGEGTGMFEFPNSKSITIIKNDITFEITDSAQKQEIIKICKDKNWGTPTSRSSLQSNSDDNSISINFNTGRAKIKLNSDDKIAVLNDSIVAQATDLYDYIIKITK